MPGILILDDDPGLRRLLETILEGEGYSIATSGSVEDGLRRAAKARYALVLCALRLPDGDGFSVVKHFAQHAPETPVVMLTSFGSIATAVEAMKQGAAGYLSKPLRSPDEVRLVVRRFLDHRRIARERDFLHEQASSPFRLDTLIAEAPAMKEVLSLAREAAPTNRTVLLIGESGTGKATLARCVHASSRRSDRLFVTVDCGASSPALMERAVERAEGGTLFLRRIKRPPAGVSTRDVRLIAATHQDLKTTMAGDSILLHVPPLRERSQDIPPLARFFLCRAAKELGKPAIEIAEDAIASLSDYPWPGNVRELKNLMERMAILCEGTVCSEDLPITRKGSTSDLVHWSDIERRAIEDALRRNKGNRTYAARELGISVRKLQYRLKEYGRTE